MSDNYFVVC